MRVSVAKKTVVNVFETQEEKKKHKHKETEERRKRKESEKEKAPHVRDRTTLNASLSFFFFFINGKFASFGAGREHLKRFSCFSPQCGPAFSWTLSHISVDSLKKTKLLGYACQFEGTRPQKMQKWESLGILVFII